MILTVPQDLTFYPTLGDQVCDFIQQNLVYGPGDLCGLPVVLEEEKQALIFRMYEVFPAGHPLQGRRRFPRVGLSLPKGLGKTELAAWIAACELHPDAPVRCTGFTKDGNPIGGPVTDPYIPMVAYTEGQSALLAYGALRTILEKSALRDDFDIGLERIERKRGDGQAVSLSSSPSARDGARTTFAVLDETHLWVLPRLKQAYQTISANLAKRKIANPWMLEITTAPEPGAGSVAEGTMEYARAVEEGRATGEGLFYFHRFASEAIDIETKDGARAAVLEASGPAASWRDIDAIVGLLDNPTTDRAYWERVWLNRLVRSSSQAFDVEKWKALEVKASPLQPNALITLGFDGAMFHDSTALVGTDVKTGWQWVEGLWERPLHLRPDDPWQVPAEEVDATVRACFQKYHVCRMYADPPYWQSWISLWIGLFGKDRVFEWFTNRRRQMSAALETFDTAIKEGKIAHDGSPDLRRHIANARREDLRERDEQGKPLWLIRKERPDSPHKIDAAMAAVLSREARDDAIKAGALLQPEYRLVVLGGKS